MHKLLSCGCTCLALAALAVLSGCATPANQEAMMVSVSPNVALSIPQELRGQVEVKDVVGGRETNPMLNSNISSSAFDAALRGSLRNAGLAAASPQAGRYLLSATIGNVQQPFLGFDMTVTMTVDYDLIERISNKTAWKTTVTRPYTAKAGDSFLGVERLRLANEGAARTNIEAFIEELTKSGPRK
ncbi:MAG TPA: hypothetical protein VIV54_03695 [Burkholderiales bacterium]